MRHERQVSAVAGEDQTNFISVTKADYMTTMLHFPVRKFNICLTSLVCLLLLYCIFCIEIDTPAEC